MTSPKTVQEMVAEFHEVYGCAIGAPWSPGLSELRVCLITEECRETVHAIQTRDLAGIAQELADLAYVVYGTAVSLGIDLDAAISEVHRANMSKLGFDGRPILREDGKVLKGPAYVPPDMSMTIDPGLRQERTLRDDH